MVRCIDATTCDFKSWNCIKHSYFVLINLNIKNMKLYKEFVFRTTKFSFVKDDIFSNFFLLLKPMTADVQMSQIYSCTKGSQTGKDKIIKFVSQINARLHSSRHSDFCLGVKSDNSDYSG